jgi:hypothetical protein
VLVGLGDDRNRCYYGMRPPARPSVGGQSRNTSILSLLPVEAERNLEESWDLKFPDAAKQPV